MFEPGHFEKMESYLPMDLLSLSNFLLACGVLYFFIIFRYFLIVGPFYLLFWKTYWFKRRQVYKQLPGRDQVLSEIRWSLLTSLVFAISGVLIGVLWQQGWTQIYLKFDDYPIWWLPASFFLMAISHEIYFYFTHRWMHHPFVYKKVHHIHHKSLRPSPWASFSFHPIESVLESLILPLLVLVIPVHPVIFILYLTAMTVSAIINHLGFELLPRDGSRHWFWGLFISATHHGQHHKYYDCNYGLYFTVLDRLMKTEDSRYHTEYKEILK